jgi:apolipoprotein N-acyltransferase
VGAAERWLPPLSGALLGAAFLPAPLGFLAWVALVPLLVALDRALAARRPPRALFGIGYRFGLVFFLIGTHWIALLSDVAITVPWLKYPAWVAAAAYLALFPGLATLLAGWLARRGRVPLAFAFPVAFMAIEELRASGELGFPWFQPGYSQHAYTRIIQMASLGSVSLVTLWLLFLNVLVWRAWAGRGMRAAWGAGLMLILPWAWGGRVLATAPREPGPVVGLVQGNIGTEIKWSGRHETEILNTFLELSRRAAAGTPRPTILIWPETATGSYLARTPDQRIALARFVGDTGVPVFSGFADYDFDARGKTLYYNAAGVFAADGSVAPRYAKRHLVPFGERMPFEWVVPALGRLELGQAEWTPGTKPVLFASAAGPFTTLICFESIFPDLTREDVRHGARWIVNITNDEWFGNSAALDQHAAMAVFRAVENHVPLARCANTGLTLVADAYGRVTTWLPTFVAGNLVAALPRPGPPTWYTRLGDWPGFASLIAAAAAALVALTRRARGH